MKTPMFQSDLHLSVIAVSRNDDHGGDLRSRMQHFVNGFIAQCRKHQLNAELILVEWNPPLDRPPLEQALEWPDDFGPAVVRVVTVPPNIHAQFPHADALPLFQMIGKNVGIRRARGRYVLATNIDILIDDATIIYLRDHLNSGVVLRADRYDVPPDLAKDVPFDPVLAECRNRFFQVNTRFGILDVRRWRFVGMRDSLGARLLALYNGIRIFGLAEPILRMVVRLFRCLLAAPMAFGRLLVGGLAAWRVALKRVSKAFARAIYLSCRAILSAPTYFRRNIPKLSPLRTMLSRGYRYIRRPLRRALRALISAQRSLAKLWRLIGPQGLFRSLPPAERRFARSQWLHTNACGDFTLLARDDWFRLRGYPEWPIFSWHVDSVFMFAADANGIKHIALGPRYRIFHIDHSVGSGWSSDGAAQLFARLDRKGVPYLSNNDVLHIRRRFAEDHSVAIVNDANWGLIDVALPEREVIPISARSLNADQRTVDIKSDSVRQNLDRVGAI